MFAIKTKFLIENYKSVLKNHCVIIDKGIIVDVIMNDDIDSKYKNIEIIDKTDSIISAGFINAHMHQYGVLSRGIPINVHFKDFEGFLNDYWWPYIEDRLNLEYVIPTTKTSAIELIESGVTAFCDTLEAPKTESGTLIEQAKIIESIGMRAVVSLESSERISKKNGMHCLEENEKAIKYLKSNSKFIKAFMCIHTTFTCSDAFIKLAYEKAKSLNSYLQFHLSESKYEPTKLLERNNTYPLVHYKSLGVLSSKILASQCVKITEEEINILKNYEMKAVHMPLSNCEVGGGFAPVPAMLKNKINVGLGTDGYINDFFEVMRGAFLMHKSVLEDASVMPSNEIFKMATENGAKSIELEKNGVIKKGYNADLIIIKDKFATSVTENNIFDQIIVHGKKEYIDSVYVAGVALMKDKKLMTVDKEACIAEMKKVADRFWQFK